MRNNSIRRWSRAQLYAALAAITLVGCGLADLVSTSRPAPATVLGAYVLQGTTAGQLAWWNGSYYTAAPNVSVDSSGNITAGSINVAAGTGATANVYGPNGAQVNSNSGVVIASKAASTTTITGTTSIATVSNGGTYICTPGTYTITIPNAASYPNREYDFIVNGSMNLGTITIADSAGTFASTGTTSMTITTANASRVLISNGTSWYVKAGIN